eukprot:scaffold3720_cov141-Cylindrotheca_fusiformis.AAC.1
MEAIVRKSDPVASPTLPGTEEPVPTPTDPPENLAGMGNCDDICDMLQKNRTEKFKGDLLEPKDLLRLAKAARDETLASMNNDYGEYFDHIFTVPVNQSDPDAGRKYDGMEGVTPDGPSADRLKRKLKLKVLKMTNAVRKAESNVNGCDCINGGGSVNGEIDESTLQPRSFYEKYVFANGGHSQGEKTAPEGLVLVLLVDLTTTTVRMKLLAMAICTMKHIRLILGKMSDAFGNLLE